MKESAVEATIVIVTHTLQQAARASETCASFVAAHGTPGVIVEHGDSKAISIHPRAYDYLNGRFG